MGKNLCFYTFIGLLCLVFVLKLNLNESQGSFGGDICDWDHGAYCNSPLKIHLNAAENEINASIKHHKDYKASVWENSLCDSIITITVNFLCFFISRSTLYYFLIREI
ncbi:hypothetical protein GIB67_029733 [Kingdonia uniflora]|uniref:Uncharacterized protein n=1 Tax=Kingdonia uniflora TaxID=39325 RepID=A0A7J7LM46_9MAGN|nr:hypothetical protein GIB67_029733 [Kingdonia uniflora]